MESTVANPVDQAQMAAVRSTLAYESQIRSGTSWFYWIAGVSLVNSVIFIAGGSLNFILGLAFTQFIDNVAAAFVPDVSPGLATALRLVAFGLDLLIAGVFALCGYLGRKRYRWVVVIGMALYVLDGLVFVAAGQWLAVVFHVWALYSLWRGLSAINNLARLQRANPPAALSPYSQQPPIIGGR